MGPFSFIPLWIVQDLVILALGLATLIFIIRKEERPESMLLELFAFCFLNAAVYENFATLMGWYGYGRSVLMIFNVPFTVPLVEYLVVYTTLRLLAQTRTPAWAKPFIVGLSGMFFDFSLDPVAMKQVFSTREGTIGRWTWYPGAMDAQIFGEPVYNFTGWVLLCGLGAAAFLLGRWWHRRSGYKPIVGLVYPFVASLAALGVLVSPFSRFLLWLWPIGEKGSVTEWIMLCANGVFGIALLAIYGRQRRSTRLEGQQHWSRARDLASEAPSWLVLAGLPLLNLAFCLGGGFWDVAWLVSAATASSLGLALWIGWRKRP